MLLNMENCQGGEPLQREVLNLFMPLKLHSAEQVDTGYTAE